MSAGFRSDSTAGAGAAGAIAIGRAVTGSGAAIAVRAGDAGIVAAVGVVDVAGVDVARSR